MIKYPWRKFKEELYYYLQITHERLNLAGREDRKWCFMSEYGVEESFDVGGIFTNDLNFRVAQSDDYRANRIEGSN